MDLEMETRISRERIELIVADVRGHLMVQFLEPQTTLQPVEKCTVELNEDEDIEFFAGMLLDPSVLDQSGAVELKEPYPYIIRINWQGEHRILSFLPWERGPAKASIRLSPLEARKIGKLAERTALINHLIKRLALEGGSR